VDAPLADWAIGTPGTDAGRVGRIGECVVYGCADSGAGDVEQIMVVAGEDLVSQDWMTWGAPLLGGELGANLPSDHAFQCGRGKLIVKRGCGIPLR
jgi:hypothetical protein